MSTFGGINTALTSLYAQRRGLDVAGENIANVNTEGYTRQKVRMHAQTGNVNPGIYSTTTQVGAGVGISGVDRSRNEYLDARGRAEHASSAYLSSQKAAYDQIESVLAEPSDTALQARLHDMWDGWNDVANNWQDPSTRSALLERSRTVAVTLNDTYGALSNQFTANRDQMTSYIDQVNTLAAGVADMNQQIAVAQSAGLGANELRDQRDLKVMQLSELVGATAQEKNSGAVNVYVGNTALVSDANASKLMFAGPSTLDSITPTNKITLKFTDTGITASAGGTMGSMLDTMNTIIPGITAKLDEVAAKLATTVNTALTGGVDSNGDPVPGGYDVNGDPGTPMFGGATAKDITVLINDPGKLAFSRGFPNDPDNTVAALDNGVADLLSDVGTSGNGPDAVYQSMIGQLGVAAQAAGRRSEIQDSVTDQVDTARDSEAGVNLDEEMTNLLTYQRGYEAASRVLTTIDSMLDQLINRTGLVGR
ncbi:MAG: flagellar hook-associated protein FlgK [Jiangellaceae bacterium]